jgi:hypothetical protein
MDLTHLTAYDDDDLDPVAGPVTIAAVAVVFGIVALAISAFASMLIVGILHAEVFSALQPAGFWTMLALAAATRLPGLFLLAGPLLTVALSKGVLAPILAFVAAIVGGICWSWTLLLGILHANLLEAVQPVGFVTASIVGLLVTGLQLLTKVPGWAAKAAVSG